MYSDAFQLDFNTGILYPKRSLLGLLKLFKLTVEVTDGKFTDKAVIEVNVLDVNQNKPVFKEPSSSNASVAIPEVTEDFLKISLIRFLTLSQTIRLCQSLKVDFSSKFFQSSSDLVI